MINGPFDFNDDDAPAEGPPPVDPADQPAPEDAAAAAGYKQQPKDDPHAARPFATWSLTQLRNLPNPGWLIDTLIPLDGVTTIIGPPKQMKTFWLLDALLSVACGVGFHGFKVEQGHVAYAAGEGLRGLQWRIGAWLARFPLEDRPHLEALIEEYFHVVPHAFKVYDQAAGDRFVATCEFFNVVAAAMDTYARMMTGGDENSAQDAGMAIETCERARAATGAAIIIVHHAVADGSRGRGSTAVLGAAACEINVKKTEDGTVVVKNTAMKEAAEFNDMHYEVLPLEYSIVLNQVDIQPTLPGGRGPAPAYQGVDPFASGGGRY